MTQETDINAAAWDMLCPNDARQVDARRFLDRCDSSTQALAALVMAIEGQAQELRLQGEDISEEYQDFLLKLRAVRNLLEPLADLELKAM